MNFPRYIYAIGGAGKNLLYTMLEKEWILREIIKPQFAPTTIDITIIDTAIDEENDDKERIKRIDTNIKKLEDEYRVNIGDGEKTIGRVIISYMLLTKDMILQSPHDLIGIGKDVKRATGADVWWINDKEKLGEDWQKKVINRQNFQELNFTKGVYRKRAIGKAIYYKALTEGKFDIDLLQTAQVDMLVGFGGGTGSGMAFDLAKKLKSIQPTADITLFGVLSTLNESPDEKANSFAMMSEIEYGHLNRDSPFKDVILIPMEITRYPGRERASDAHESLLREFDETVPYILMAYHNNPAQLFFSGLPGYAPFIVATSQLVRYNVASIKRLKDKLIEAFNTKESSLKDEEDIYASISKFMNEFYADGLKAGQLPNEDKTFIKDDRFSKFKTVLDHQFFKELDYNSVKYLKRAVEAGIAGAGSEDIEKHISSIKAEVETISIGEEGYKEDADMRLHKILKKDIETIDAMKDLLNIVNNIPNNIVRDTLKIIIKTDEYSLGRKLNQIREEIDKFTSKSRQLEGSAKTIEESINIYDEKIRKDVDINNQEWRQNERKNIEILGSMDDIVSTLNNDFANLKDELNEYATRINSLNSIKTIDAEGVRNVENITDKIFLELSNVGIYYEGKTSISKNLINLKDFKKSQIDSKKGVPIVDKILGIAIKTDRIKKQKDAKTKVMLKITEVNSDNVFEVKDALISSVYQYEVDQKLDERRKEITDGITKRLQDKFSNTIQELFIELETSLLDRAKRNTVGIDDIVKSHLSYNTDIQKKYEVFKEKKIEIAKLSEEIKQFRSLEALLKNNTPAIKRHSGGLKNYYDSIANVEKDVSAMHGANRDVIRYIMEMQPTNIYRATLTGANINTILVDKDEMSSLKQNLQGGLERTIDNRYNVLVRRTIESADNMKRWNKTKVMNTFVTLANIQPDDIDARRTITNAFSVSANNYSQWKCSSGDIWEVGMVMFIAGVPLDNIRNVTDQRAGYYRDYENVSKNEMIFFHHSYMLDKGKFVQRLKVFNIENEEDKALFLQDDKNIRSAFLQNYKEVDIRKSLNSGEDEEKKHVEHEEKKPVEHEEKKL